MSNSNTNQDSNKQDDRELEPHFLQIPTPVVKDDDLQPTDRMVYGAVYFYSQFKDGYCKASNGTLGRAANITPKTVRNCLTRLEENGHIKREYKTKHRSKRLAIHPLVAIPGGGVSSNRDRGVPKQGQGVSLDNEHNKKSTEKRNKSENKKTMQKNQFDTFWEAYPRKVGKQRAKQVFLKLEQDKFAAIMKALQDQKDTTQWQRNGGQFIPHPTTWINQGRWEDDPEAYNHETEDKETGVEVKSY